MPTLLFLVLLPVLPAIWLIATRSVADALVDVYLPALFFVPIFYRFEIPHFIGFNACDAALLPIVVVTLVKYGRQWRWRRADLWLILFAAGYGYSLGISASTGLRAFVNIVFSAVLPYIVGKMLIEQQGIRERFVRRMVWLSAIVALLSLVEFRLSKNLFLDFYSSIFSKGSPNIEQIRGGFTRVQGPFEHAIVAGIIFGTVWIFALWLSYVDKLKLGTTEPKYCGLRRSVILMGCSFLGLGIALSRGPWLGAALAFPIARIGAAKNVARTAIIAALLVLTVGGAAYVYLDAYTSGTIGSAIDQDQENAIYRRVLLESYGPIAKAGGLFGWGDQVPVVPGEPSVDNNYLLLQLRQGLVGLFTFLLLALESIIATLVSARRATEKSDFYFYMSLLGIVCGLLLTLATAGLSSASVQIYYLCIGWGLASQQRVADAGDLPLQEFEAPLATTPRIFA